MTDNAEKDVPDDIVATVACPACGAEMGQPCRTMIEGIDMRWTHDARVYAVMGVRPIPPGGGA